MLVRSKSLFIVLTYKGALQQAVSKNNLPRRFM